MAFVLNNPKIVSHALTGVHRNIPRYESINYSRSDPKLKSQSYQNEASTVAAKVRFDRLGVDGVGEDWWKENTVVQGFVLLVLAHELVQHLLKKFI